MGRWLVRLVVAAQISFGAGAVEAQCAGDCSGDGAVSVDEIIRGVSIALGAADLGTCDAVDSNGDGQVTVDEIITAVSNALSGCGEPSTPAPTPTATATPTTGAMPTATVSVPGCANGSVDISFAAAVDTNAETSSTSLTLTAGAEVRDPRSGVYIWGITANVCDSGAPLLRSLQIQVIGPRTGFVAGSHPITPPLGSLVYVESPAFGSVQPRIWQTTGATLVIDSVDGSSLTFHVEGAPMVPNLIVAGNPPPQGTFQLSATGQIGFTSQ